MYNVQEYTFSTITMLHLTYTWKAVAYDRVISLRGEVCVTVFHFYQWLNI